MRVAVGAASAGNQPTRLLTKRADHKCYGVVIQVIDNISVFFSNQQADLQQKDSTGTPTGGFILTGAMNTPFFIQEWTDDLFAVASAAGKVEIQQYAISS